MAQETIGKKSWASLATKINADDSLDTVLENAKANYKVTLEPVQVWDTITNSVVPVKNRFVTTRENPNGAHCDHWEVVKDRYEVVQNKDILKRARAIVDRSTDPIKLHNCGVLDDGRKFFASIHFGNITLNSQNGDTVIDNYLIVMSSHDGSIPICYYNLDVRRGINSVYRFSSSEYDFDLRKRHTPNLKDQKIEASEALILRKQWTLGLVDAIKVLQKPVGTSLYESTLNLVSSIEKANTKKKRDHAESVHEKIEEIYRKNYNCGQYGESRWALFNAVVEYIDFHRDIDPFDAAQHSLEIDNYSHRLKVEVFNLLK
tara:strand:+ start:3604 stop:4554 length:951 start_codon:yes stop_codon:yes gene_type:complete